MATLRRSGRAYLVCHSRFNHYGVVLGCTLQDGVCGDLIIKNHRTPTRRFPLRADNSTQINFASLLQNFKKDFHLTLVGNGMQQKIVQDEQGGTTDLLQALLVLGVVLRFERHQRRQEGLAVVVLHLIVAMPIALAK